MNLDGEWAGNYLYPLLGESEWPIVARFKVIAGLLEGTMVDERTTRTETIQDVLRTIPANAPHLRNWIGFLVNYPDAILTSTFPASSRLRGTVRGQVVHFTKEYSGDLESVWSAPNLEAMSEIDAILPIEFEGEVNSEGTEILGAWTIVSPSSHGDTNELIASGTFRLNRQS